jgi:hypothetical protein
MSNYNTSREPMTIDEFIALAETDGWTRVASHADQPNDEVTLADVAGRMIVAYPQPTQFSDHIGFKGSNYGLLEVWEEGSLEQKFLEGQDPDEETPCAEELAALAAVLLHYESRQDLGDTVRAMLTDIGSRF